MPKIYVRATLPKLLHEDCKKFASLHNETLSKQIREVIEFWVKQDPVNAPKIQKMKTAYGEMKVIKTNRQVCFIHGSYLNKKTEVFNIRIEEDLKKQWDKFKMKANISLFEIMIYYAVIMNGRGRNRLTIEDLQPSKNPFEIQRNEEEEEMYID